MGRGSNRKIVKYTAKEGTLQQFCKRRRSGRPKVRYNPLKENDESTSNVRKSSRSVLKPITIEKLEVKKLGIAEHQNRNHQNDK